MRESFLLVTAGIGAVVGLLVAVSLDVVVTQTLAYRVGTATACLFVGAVVATVWRS